MVAERAPRDRPRRLRPPADVDGSTQQAVVNRIQRDQSVGRPLLVHVVAHFGSKGVGVAFAFAEPRGCGRPILSRLVDLLGLDEPGRPHQRPVGVARRDVWWPRCDRSTPSTRVEIWGDLDHDGEQATTWSEEASLGSQHGELGSKSTQHIGRAHRIEHSTVERRMLPGGRDHGHPIVEPVTSRAVDRSPEPFGWDVGRDH